MDRVIYCPSQEMFSEAEKLSRLHLAPILIGDNERTSSMDFDRSKPCVLSIPVNHYVYISHDELFQGIPFRIAYVNEFKKIDDMKFEVLSHRIGEPNGRWPLTPLQKERHLAVFGITPSEWDTFTFFATIGDEVIDSFDFEVKKKHEQ